MTRIDSLTNGRRRHDRIVAAAVVFNKLLTLLALCALLPSSAALAQQTADVPYVSTPSIVVHTMLEMARVRSDDYLIDLGSGDGRIVIEASKRSGARGLGVEIDGNLVFRAKEAAKREGVSARTAFVQDNLFNVDIGKATVLTMYLLPKINLQLRPRILSQMRPGTRVVSHDFDMGAWIPDAKLEMEVPDKPYGPPLSRIYLWYVPANVAGKWRWQLPVGGALRLYEAKFEQNFQELIGEALVDGGTAAWQGARLQGDLITVNLVREFMGRKFVHELTGRVEGDRIVGRARITGGGENATLDWEATRVERGKMTIE